MPGLGQPNTELHGWKEIATYLRVSVRKAQLLEKERCLPVRRGIGPKAPVFAYVTDLDAWRSQVETVPAKVSESDALPGPLPGPPLVPDELPVTNQRQPTALFSRRQLLLGGGATLVAASGIGLARILRTRSAEIVRADVVGNTLCAWDAGGAAIWKHAFSEPLRTRAMSAGGRFGERVQVVNTGTNGERYVVFAAAFATGGETPDLDELYCFSSKGDLLWRYRPEFNCRFGSDRFDGPWLIHNVILVPEKPRPTLMVAVSHWMWRPGFVVRIDLQGSASIRLADAGQIYALQHVNGPAGGYVLAGGINNEYNAAAIAILKDGSPAARSPQTPGTPFEVLDGPTGTPDRYFLLPPSELTMASGTPYNIVVRIRDVDGSIMIETSEVLRPQYPIASAIYFFNRSLEPELFSYGLFFV